MTREDWLKVAEFGGCGEALSSPRGGLMMICGIYPPTPLANIEALLAAMRRYRSMHAGA